MIGKAYEEKEGWIPWNGGDCPVDVEMLVDVEFRTGRKEKMIAKNFLWQWEEEKHRSDIVAYKVKENKVDQLSINITHQPKSESAKKPHKHAAMISEWIKDTSRTVEVKINEGEWGKISCPSWSQTFEYRFADEAKPECVSPLSEEELNFIWEKSISGSLALVNIANAAHRSALKWVAELPAVTSLTLQELDNVGDNAPFEGEYHTVANAAIAAFQASLKRMVGE